MFLFCMTTIICVRYILGRKREGQKSLCENEGALARMVQKTADLSTALQARGAIISSEILLQGEQVHIQVRCVLKECDSFLQQFVEAQPWKP
jgi:hypothetical protein